MLDTVEQSNIQNKIRVFTYHSTDDHNSLDLSCESTLRLTCRLSKIAPILYIYICIYKRFHIRLVDHSKVSEPDSDSTPDNRPRRLNLN